MVDKKIATQNNQEIEIMKQEINQLKESVNTIVNALSAPSVNNTQSTQTQAKKGGNKNAKQYTTKDF